MSQSFAVSIFGSAVLALLLAGYLAQNFLPPPTPKIVGIDLGTTYSCIGVYQAVTGQVDVIKDKNGKGCIPSIVAFSEDDVLVGYRAMAQADANAANTVYDAKRFIGKSFGKDELATEAGRYEFKMQADEYGMVRFVVGPAKNRTALSPEQVGSQIINTLKHTAQANLSVPVLRAVMSVPAEFNEKQRNFTKMAAKLAGIDVLRVINEPTAAALAYGLHKKQGVRNVMVVDLGGGTLDVSLLVIQGGMFLTQAMAGNNHLGGQDFNQRLLTYLLKQIHQMHGKPLTDVQDLQALRMEVENAKLNLTYQESATLKVPLFSFKTRTVPVYTEKITKAKFEELNMDLFKKVLEPIIKCLDSIEVSSSEVDEVVLVGGSTRIPKVRELIRDYFNKEPNVAIDPELAVAYGVSIQAGILGGMWPLTVSAIELPIKAKKILIK